MSQMSRKIPPKLMGRNTVIAEGADINITPGSSMILRNSEPSYVQFKHQRRRTRSLRESKSIKSLLPELDDDYMEYNVPPGRMRSTWIRAVKEPPELISPTRASRSTIVSLPGTHREKGLETTGGLYAIESVYRAKVPSSSESEVENEREKSAESESIHDYDVEAVGEEMGESDVDADVDVEVEADFLELHIDREDKRVIDFASVDEMRQRSILSEVSVLTGRSGISGKSLTIDDVLEGEEGEEMELSESVRDSGSCVREVTLRQDFFNDLAYLPGVDEISLGSSHSLGAVTATSVTTVTTDIGRFVNPLTGGSLTSSVEEMHKVEEAKEKVKKIKGKGRGKSDKEQVEEKAAEAVEVPEAIVVEEAEVFPEEEEEEKEYELPEDDDLLALIEIDDELMLQEKEQQQNQPVEETIEQFLETETGQIVALESIVDLAEIKRQQEKQKVIEQTSEFLDILITLAVERSEQVDPKKEHRFKLDKVKLIRQIEHEMTELEIEQRMRYFLNRKTVDYFRRKKIFRTILEDNPETIMQNMDRYREVASYLDHLLGQEKEIRESTECKIETLRTQLVSERIKTRAIIKKLENLITETLVRESSKFKDKMFVLVKTLLSQMKALRDEISEVRLVLIQRQHSYAAMAQKLEQLQDIGDGLRMQDFEQLQTETMALGKKIEERNSDLAKVRGRCTIEFHMIAHMRERQQMLRGSITTQRAAYEQLKQEKIACRQRMYDAKMERNRLRHEIKELSFQGGLLDKPELMLDYDKTAEAVANFYQKVGRMKTQHKNLLQRIAESEQLLMKNV